MESAKSVPPVPSHLELVNNDAAAHTQIVSFTLTPVSIIYFFRKKLKNYKNINIVLSSLRVSPCLDRTLKLHLELRIRLILDRKAIF